MKKTTTTSELNELLDLVVESVLDENQGRLRDIFFEPVKDVVKTISYGAEKLSNATQGLVKGLAYLIPTVIVPGLEFDYNTFRKDENAKMMQIKKKYGDVLERNWEAIKDPDVFGFLFLAYPQSMLGYSLLKKSPMAFLQILETVTGGNPSVRAVKQSLEQSAAYSQRKNQPRDPSGGSFSAGMGRDDIYGGGGFGESYLKNGTFLNESLTQQQMQQILNLVRNPEVQNSVQNSTFFRDMIGASISIMTAPVSRVMKMTKLDQLKTVIKPDAIEQAKQEMTSKVKNKQEISKIETELVDMIKDTYKKEYIKFLKGQIQKKPKAAPAINRAVEIITAMKE